MARTRKPARRSIVNKSEQVTVTLKSASGDVRLRAAW